MISSLLRRGKVRLVGRASPTDHVKRRIESWQPLNLVSARERKSQIRSDVPERKSYCKAAVCEIAVNASSLSRKYIEQNRIEVRRYSTNIERSCKLNAAKSNCVVQVCLTTAHMHKKSIVIGFLRTVRTSPSENWRHRNSIRHRLPLSVMHARTCPPYFPAESGLGRIPRPHAS